MPLSFQISPVNTGSYDTGRLLSHYPDGNDGYNINGRVMPTGIGVNFSGYSCQVPVWGFRHVMPSVDSRIILVSDSEGNDSNTFGNQADFLAGNIGPVKTLQRAMNLQRNNYPDHIYLKRGDVWLDQRLWGWKSGRSIFEPTVWGFYGSSGPRPKISWNGSGSLTQGARDHIFCTGIEFHNYKFDFTRPDFDPVNDPTTSNRSGLTGVYGLKNVWYDDCEFSHTEPSYNGFTEVISNVAFTRCIFRDNYTNETSLTQNSRPSNLFVSYNHNGFLMHECISDMGGWNDVVPNAGANHYCHTMYLQAKCNGNQVRITNNIITRSAGQGIMNRCGGIVDNNFVWNCSVGIRFGYLSQHPVGPGTKVWYRNNVVMEPRNHHDRGCQATGCSNAQWGIELAINEHCDGKLVNNIVAHNDLNQSGNKKALEIRTFVTPEYWTQSVIPQKDEANIYYLWENETQGLGPSYPDPGRKLGDYNASIGGANDPVDFINVCRSRQIRQWDWNYSAPKVNNFIREGFGKAPIEGYEHGGN